MSKKFFGVNLGHPTVMLLAYYCYVEGFMVLMQGYMYGCGYG